MAGPVRQAVASKGVDGGIQYYHLYPENVVFVDISNLNTSNNPKKGSDFNPFNDVELAVAELVARNIPGPNFIIMAPGTYVLTADLINSTLEDLWFKGMVGEGFVGGFPGEGLNGAPSDTVGPGRIFGGTIIDLDGNSIIADLKNIHLSDLSIIGGGLPGGIQSINSPAHLTMSNVRAPDETATAASGGRMEIANCSLSKIEAQGPVHIGNSVIGEIEVDSSGEVYATNSNCATLTNNDGYAEISATEINQVTVTDTGGLSETRISARKVNTTTITGSPKVIINAEEIVSLSANGGGSGIDIALIAKEVTGTISGNNPGRLSVDADEFSGSLIKSAGTNTIKNATISGGSIIPGGSETEIRNCTLETTATITGGSGTIRINATDKGATLTEGAGGIVGPIHNSSGIQIARNSIGNQEISRPTSVVESSGAVKSIDTDGKEIITMATTQKFNTSFVVNNNFIQSASRDIKIQAYFKTITVSPSTVSADLVVKLFRDGTITSLDGISPTVLLSPTATPSLYFIHNFIIAVGTILNITQVLVGDIITFSLENNNANPLILDTGSLSLRE